MFLNHCGKVNFGAQPAIIKFFLQIPPEYYFFSFSFFSFSYYFSKKKTKQKKKFFFSSYPYYAPEIVILSNVIHPLVHPIDKKVDLRHQFAPWRPNKDHICHLLHYLKAIFSEKMLDNLQENLCPNKEAYKLYLSIFF